ncbi:Protein of unknown function [Pyronema omphalodes CBS 100304]|uniref:Uncharacterized protein n=1 Tax=Pyronema omphalodes (strain CBS 100304) TaxID=1076935 RepID=U4LPF0_PYROM|nr:Protein of unknown function [Pyronema omphalodes CBS 100304]
MARSSSGAGIKIRCSRPLAPVCGLPGRWVG